MRLGIVNVDDVHEYLQNELSGLIVVAFKTQNTVHVQFPELTFFVATRVTESLGLPVNHMPLDVQKRRQQLLPTAFLLSLQALRQQWVPT